MVAAAELPGELPAQLQVFLLLIYIYIYIYIYTYREREMHIFVYMCIYIYIYINKKKTKKKKTNNNMITIIYNSLYVCMHVTLKKCLHFGFVRVILAQGPC